MLNLLDLCSGTCGFSYAASLAGRFNIISVAETDPYNAKIIENNFNYENAGSVSEVAISNELHSCQVITAQDKVPVEETGYSPLTMQDFLEGAVEFPDILTSGFPCQDASSANLNGGLGIYGERTGLVFDNINTLRNLEVPYAIFENSPLLKGRGLDVILMKLNELNYIVEFETVSAVHFGFPHYRKRLYICAYLPSTAMYLNNFRIFDEVILSANKKPDFYMPLILNNPDWYRQHAIIDNPKSIPFRTKRINAMGNAIIPQIVKPMFEAIIKAEDYSSSLHKNSNHYKREEFLHAELKNNIWVDSKKMIAKMPQNGFMKDGKIYTSAINRILNPKNTQYKGLVSTLLKKDGNNNLNPSRLTRPGKLGGLVGDLMRYTGANKGGINPNFAELMMGYPTDYTKLK